MWKEYSLSGKYQITHSEFHFQILIRILEKIYPGQLTG